MGKPTFFGAFCIGTEGVFLAKGENELLLAVRQLARQRNLPNRVVVVAIEDALASAYRRDPISNGQEVTVSIDPNTGDVAVFTAKRVVPDDEISNSEAEIGVTDAQKVTADIEVGTLLKTGELQYNPGRAAANTTRQVITQRLRDAQRNLVFEEYLGQEGRVLSGKIHKIEGRNVIIDLGTTTAIMPPIEHAEFERYRPGQNLKVYITKVERTPQGPEIVVSRSHPNLLRVLLEAEVPEISSGAVEIKAIAREAGSRSKVAVTSHDEHLDAVGACVGLRGIRIQSVVNELMGEKIDIVEWNEEVERFIANALSPASVTSVEIEPGASSANVLVPEAELSLAIGREGQNARLASKLANWAIEISGIKEEKKEPEARPGPRADMASVQSSREKARAGKSSQKSEPEGKEKIPVGDEANTEAVGVIKEESEDEEALRKKRVREEQELLALEEELAELERQEKERLEEKRQEAEPSANQDVWDVGFLQDNSIGNSADGLRFAEDIDTLRERSEGPRQKKRGARKKSRNS